MMVVQLHEGNRGRVHSLHFTWKGTGIVLAISLALFVGTVSAAEGGHAVPRQWMDELLDAISNDRAQPTVHARNLHHLSVAMWDAWAAYDPIAEGYLYREDATAEDIAAARDESMSYAAFRLLLHRFEPSPGWAPIQVALFDRMEALDYDPEFTDTTGDSPAALGNRIAEFIIAHGLQDGSNEANEYASQFYQPVNEPLDPLKFGNPDIDFPDYWQPLKLDEWCDQFENCYPAQEPVPFLSPEWGLVTPFALTERDLDIHTDPDGNEWWVYLDPGPPPRLANGDGQYHQTFAKVIEYSSLLDPDQGEPIDISPASIGNNTPGTNDGTGYEVNQVTGDPYEPQYVPPGDYYRVLAEFWADGPASETPPGHWFSILHYVSEHPDFEMQFAGRGDVLNARDWYVKAYLALGGAVHDAAIAAWSVKGYHDYVRPISAIRYMGEKGQSSDPEAPSWDPEGLPLQEGLIEVITVESSGAGERHEHLNKHVGKIAIRTWTGHVEDAEIPYAGVDWILAGNWWPYQQPRFVTPPFAGYVSGHSTFSRAAAETLERITGSKYFPGGLGEFPIAQNEFLEFEQGPSVDLVLQWASYADAADECSLSRIYGGIHPPADDVPGRLMGLKIGPKAFNRALGLIRGDSIFANSFAVGE